MKLKDVSRPGYTLKGWKVGNTEEILAVGSEYKPTKSITLTAVWGQDVTVTYSEGEPAAAGTKAGSRRYHYRRGARFQQNPGWKNLYRLEG